MLPRGTPIGPVIELQIRRALETWEGGAPVATAFIIAVELHVSSIIQMRYTMSPTDRCIGPGLPHCAIGPCAR